MSAIEELVAELAKLPGIGRKTAQRLTFHLLKQPPDVAERLWRAIQRVRGQVAACATCGTPNSVVESCSDRTRSGVNPR